MRSSRLASADVQFRNGVALVDQMSECVPVGLKAIAVFGVQKCWLISSLRIVSKRNSCPVVGSKLQFLEQWKSILLCT